MSLKYRFQAWRQLIKLYWDIFRHFWQHRHTLTLPSLQAHEAEFLPAALSIQAKPISPAGLWVARILILLVMALLVWSVMGHIDITVNADGKIIANGYTKTIASVEVASVYALHVEEGQAVRAGQVLIELDSRETDSDRDKAEGERQIAMLQAARSHAILKAIDKGESPRLPVMNDVARFRWQDAASHLRDQWRDYTAKKAQFDSQIAHYAEALPLARQQESDYAELSTTHDVAQHAWMDKQRARMDLDGQLDDARSQKTTLTAETRKTAQDELNDASRIVASSIQDENKARAHDALLKLVSPVDGTVQQLTVHTIGGVVPAAQPLMQIVPRQTSVEMEAFLQDKDVGFVQEGQNAEVKIDAFDYTKYGTVSAKVSHVSRDAIQDEKKGLLYSIKVTVLRPNIFVDGHYIALTPGMSGNVEIKTGTRRVIEYVLSPLIEYGQESLHER